MQAGPDGGVAFLFGRAAPDPVHLPGLYREVKTLAADQAARAYRLGLGYLGLATASGRHGEEQVGVGGPARRQRLPLPAPGQLYQQKSEVMLLHDGSMTPGQVSAPQAIRVIFARVRDFP